LQAATAAVTTSPWFVLVEVEDPVAVEVPDEVSTTASAFEDSCFASLESVDELLVVDDSSVVSAVEALALPTTNTCDDGVPGWW
jgi:hypothetical protein